MPKIPEGWAVVENKSENPKEELINLIKEEGVLQRGIQEKDVIFTVDCLLEDLKDYGESGWALETIKNWVSKDFFKKIVNKIFIATNIKVDKA